MGHLDSSEFSGFGTRNREFWRIQRLPGSRAQSHFDDRAAMAQAGGFTLSFPSGCESSLHVPAWAAPHVNSVSTAMDVSVASISLMGVGGSGHHGQAGECDNSQNPGKNDFA
jgi:hypothetical protein